jgi:hypothetical protein
MLVTFGVTSISALHCTVPACEPTGCYREFFCAIITLQRLAETLAGLCQTHTAQHLAVAKLQTANATRVRSAARGGHDSTWHVVGVEPLLLGPPKAV